MAKTTKKKLPIKKKTTPKNPRKESKLKQQHRALNNKEPFTYSERQQFNAKDRSMIRNVQILNKINKDDAIQVLKKYKTSPKNALKKLAKQYKKSGKLGESPGKKREVRGKISKHGKRQSQRVKGTLQNNRKDVLAYLNNPKNKNQANYKKVEKGSKKYIDASKQELIHGVNSNWSQKYREKNGLSAKYEGRTIK